MEISATERVKVVKPGRTYEGRQGFVYGSGASAETVGTERICMNVLPMPLGAKAKVHYHDKIEKPSPISSNVTPRLGPAVNAHGCFSVGDRAMKLDPICGDGTGQGTKSAILAVAAANALRMGHEVSRVKQHVLARHSFAFRTHLMHCGNYYETIASKVF